jgi:ABC-type uncharacterized transport system auxiliary subunit
MTVMRRRCLVALVLTAPLGGCASMLIGSRTPPTEFRLMPETGSAEDLPKVDWVLIVAEPNAEGALDSERIAVLSDGVRIQPLAEAVWSDRPTAMLQFAIVQAFQRSGRLPAVGTDRDALPGRFLLQSNLDAFQLEPDGRGFAVDMSLHARLLRLPTREVVGATELSRRVPATGNSNEQAVAAFNHAAGGVLDDLIAWTIRTGRGRR